MPLVVPAQLVATALFDALLLLAPSALAVAPSAAAAAATSAAAMSAASEPDGGGALLTNEARARGFDFADENSPPCTMLRLRLIARDELNFATATALAASAETSDELRSSEPTIARTLVGRSVSPLALCQSILIWCERGTIAGSGTPAGPPGESRSAPADTPLPGASGELTGGSPFGVGGVRPKKPVERRVGERRDGMRTGLEETCKEEPAV